VIPAEQTLIILADELEGARSWAERHGVTMEWLPGSLELHVTLVQPETNYPFLLRGRFLDYRALPPEWTFSDEKWQQSGRRCDSPKGVPIGRWGTIFIDYEGIAVICAPFNRLAYREHAGPHADWSGPANWLNAAAGRIHADTIGDMLQSIYRDFLFTRERMAHL
jgi:hypothetical protein